MIFYKHYIGDFQRDTGHLSLTERGAYRALMDHYYSIEQPLPSEHAALCRIAGAFSKPERDAVKVAMGFFEKRDGKLWHKRIEAELEKQEGRSDTNRRIALEREARKRAEKEELEQHDKTTNRAPGVPRTDHDQSTNQNHSQNQDTEIPAPTVLVASPSGDATAGTVVRLPERRIPCPAEDLLDAFHTACPTLPRVMKLNGNRRTHLTARWREVDADSKFENAADGVAIFKAIFERVNSSDFLAGRAKTWHATFDWLIQSTNFLKVCEGQYDNGKRQAQ